MADHSDDMDDHEEVPSSQETSPPRPPNSSMRKAERATGAGYRENEDEEDVDADEDDEGGDEDDEDEEEDDEEDSGRPQKKKRKTNKPAKPAGLRFLDVEAEVDDDDEEFEDDEEELGRETRGFIEDDESLQTPDGLRRITADHQRLDRRAQEATDMDAVRIAQGIKQRHRRTTARYAGDGDTVPQRLLMPSVNDPFLWQVRVKPGKERDLVFSLMRKAIDKEFSARPLQIMSAFYRDSLPGMIYVEARSEPQVLAAVQGLIGVYASRGTNLVPIDEMASLLRIKKQQSTVTVGSWVRVKKGKYTGDLAQVTGVTDNGEMAELKLVPRIDLTPKEGGDGRKRKKTTSGMPLNFRPPPRFFNPEEINKVYGTRAGARRQGQKWLFNGEEFVGGYLQKDHRITAISTENVNPTLDEITAFTAVDRESNENGTDPNIDLSVIANAARKAATIVLQPGDQVEVFEGEQTGVHGVVDSIRGDIAVLRAKNIELEGQKIEVPAASVRKRFNPGDHVKVMAGTNADETGLVVSVSKDVVTIWSDLSNAEVTVFTKDVREAAEVGASTNVVGEYELHDLVQLDQQTVGVICKTERVSLRVLDQNGNVRIVQPHQITMRRDSRHAIATDAEGHPLNVNDNMKEIDGEGRKGRVLHIHQSTFAFLHNREIVENGGVFVTRCRSLVSLAPRGAIGARPGAPGLDLSKMNPAVGGGAVGGVVGSGAMTRGPKDRLIGTHIVVVKGEYKGYLGTIKDTNGNFARVELHTGNKLITMEKEKLRRKGANGQIEPLEGPPSNAMGPPSAGPRMGPPGGGRTPNPYAQAGSRTPAWGSSGRTPNPYAADGGRTPAWSANSRTPNPYADGGKTPAWNASSRTPNPYASDGGKTPAWNASSRTPNPYVSGGKTPSGAGSSSWGTPSRATDGWGANTPARGATSWGATSPANGNAGASGSGGQSGSTGWASRADSGDWGAPQDGDWGANVSSESAPTPYTAPTPGYGAASTPYSAPTPGAYGAPTPAAFTAPTPAYTPGFQNSSRSAPTPFGAPTPYTGQENDESGNKAAWSLDRNWLRGLKNVYATINSHGKWSDGHFDDREVLVVAVLDMDSAEFTNTASFEYVNENGQKVERGGCPIEFLSPVHPSRRGEKAYPLEGKWKGKLVRLENSDRDSKTADMWLLKLVDPKLHSDHSMEGCPAHRMVKAEA